jgi:hypothetical protein
VYHWRFWIALGISYFVIHFALGVYNCEKYMCPGDVEGDWVLEFTDEDTGERMIKQNGKIITKQQWLQERARETTR